MRYLVLFVCIFSLNCSWEGKCFPTPYVISIDNSDYPIETIEGAVEYWNETIGQEIFIIDGPGQITIHQYDKITCGGLNNVDGCAYPIIERGKIRSCRIDMRISRGYKAVEILAHEFGHCMGLAHSDETCIMFPYVNGNFDLLDEHYEHIESCMEE